MTARSSTIHANRPREALTRLENMVGMAGVKLPAAVRQQIAAAVDMIVQISRMRDGMRRITYITEIVGMEGDIITTQDLFTYQFEGECPTAGSRAASSPPGCGRISRRAPNISASTARLLEAV